MFVTVFSGLFQGDFTPPVATWDPSLFTCETAILLHMLFGQQFGLIRRQLMFPACVTSAYLLCMSISVLIKI